MFDIEHITSPNKNPLSQLIKHFSKWLQYYWMVTLFAREYNEFSHCDWTQVNVNSTKNNTRTFVSFQTIILVELSYWQNTVYLSKKTLPCPFCLADENKLTAAQEISENFEVCDILYCTKCTWGKLIIILCDNDIINILTK